MTLRLFLARCGSSCRCLVLSTNTEACRDRGRSLITVLLLLLLAPKALAAEWDPIPGIPEPAFGIHETNSMLNGEVKEIGGPSIISRGFQWDTDSGTTYANNWEENGTWGTGSFSHDITGLTPGTVYYYRAKAKNNSVDAWAYGNEVKFLTLPWNPSNFIASGGDERVNLSWDKGQGR